MGQTIQPQGGGVAGESGGASGRVVLKTSRFAVRNKDVIYMDQAGRIYPAQSVTYINGAATNGTTLGQLMTATVTINSSNAFNDSKNAMVVNSSNEAMYFAYPHLSVGNGLSIARSAVSPLAASSVVIDSDASGNSCHGVNLVQLSNGNLLAVWSRQTIGIYYAIIDLDLNIIVAKTLLVATGAGAEPTYAIPLSAGGFAFIANLQAASPTFGIRTNTGAVTLANTTIAAFPSAGRSKLAQLSNGNIAIAVTSIVAGKTLMHAVYTAVGAVVVAATVLDASAPAGTGYPSLSVLPGFYCIGHVNSVNNVVQVLSNAGVVQGAPYTAAAVEVFFPYVDNDGQTFWFVYRGTGSVINIVKVPLTGTNYVTNVTALNISPGCLAIGFDQIIIGSSLNGGQLDFFEIRTTGAVNYLASQTNTVTPSNATLRILSNFTFVTFQNSGVNAYNTMKYMTASLIGVSATTVAAGNPGSNVSVLLGPGTFQTNALIGVSNLTFTHVAGPVVGNYGTAFQTSIALKGY
jgi:hypothetical protein